MHRRIVKTEQRQGHQLAVAGKNGISPGQLDQADGDAVTVGHRGLFDRLPGFPGPQAAIDLAGETEIGHLAEADAVEHFPHFLGRETERDLGRTDVGRFLDDLGHGQRAVGMRIGNGGRANAQLAGRGIDHRVEAHLAAIERQGRRKRLHHRPRLEGVGDGAIA